MSVVTDAQRAHAAKLNILHGRRSTLNARRRLCTLLFLHAMLLVMALYATKVVLRKEFFTLKLPFGGGVPASSGSVASPLQLLATTSPLQEFALLDATHDSLSDEDRLTLSEIEREAALDVKFFAIPETVFRVSSSAVKTEEDDKSPAAAALYEYVETQMSLAKEVITGGQAESVLAMVQSGMSQASVVKKEMGSNGSLKNSMVLALMCVKKGAKEDADAYNVHFAMTAVSVEPRLGWRLISRRKRNVWNAVMNKIADARLKQETSKLFGGASAPSDDAFVKNEKHAEFGDLLL